MKHIMLIFLACGLTACAAKMPSIQQSISERRQDARLQAYSLSDTRSLEPSTTYDGGRF